MSQQLVVAAIGKDTTGIVSKLAHLVADCNCNINDSRMAIFGNEFTFIMLISGAPSAISRIEHLLPGLGMELELTTMTKRTTERPVKPAPVHYVLEYHGPDKVGTLDAVTGLLAKHNIYIGSLQSTTIPHESGQDYMQTTMTLELSDRKNILLIESGIMSLLKQFNLTGSFYAQN